MFSQKVKDLLPIGSVVLLNDAEKKLMIYGIRQTDNNRFKDYDYIGVLYPEGGVGQEMHFLFNHSDIKETFFRGYEDKDREAFIRGLSNFYHEE